MPGPLRIAVQRGPHTSTYALRTTIITLRGGRTQRIYFFVREPSGPVPSEALKVHEDVRAGLPDHQLATIADAIVQMLGCTPRQAAWAAARFKRNISGLSAEDTRQLAERIQVRLEA